MSETIFNNICYIWIGLALAVHITMFYITAPFGRHTSDKWGKSMNNKAGWIIMEMPSLIIMLYFLLQSKSHLNNYSILLFCFWILHYFNRVFIYPFRIKATLKKIPVFIVLNAVFFNVVNAGINGYYLSEFTGSENINANGFGTFHFIVGIILFFSGFAINNISDTILIGLRKGNETGYKIPYGFLFKYVSAPNLLGEIIEWSGFALMAWNLPATAFLIWTFANLVPRAKNHHDWYLRNFENYPKERKIIFPYLF